MTILDLVLKAYNIVGTGSSMIGGINYAIKHFCQTTAEEIFKKSFVKVVKQYASDFADFTDPKTVKSDIPNSIELFHFERVPCCKPSQKIISFLNPIHQSR